MKAFAGKGVVQRRGLPISAYVGANGGGKTLAMIHDTLPTLRGLPWHCEVETHRHTAQGVTRGMRSVLSTVTVLDGDGETPHPLFERLTSWRQLVVAEHCDVLLDEVTGSASARSYQAMPPQLLQLFVQLRKADVVVRYTTPNWARTDVVLREVTQAVTVCKGFFWEKSPGLLWPSKRMFRWATYDAMDWEEMSLEKVARARPLMVAWYYRPGREAMRRYNTRDAVATLDHVSESGLCLECGGTRVRQRCSCGDGDGGGGGAHRPASRRQPAPAGRRPRTLPVAVGADFSEGHDVDHGHDAGDGGRWGSWE